MNESVVVVFLIMFAAIYFLPWVIAILRDHHQNMAIGALNLFLGWTVIGWIVALEWSVTSTTRGEQEEL